MRNYFTTPNLCRGALLSAIVTLMSIGRIVQGNMLLRVTMPEALVACFFSMTLVCATVTAWGKMGGMPGVITDRRTFLRGSALALLFSLAALPVYRYALDPLFCRILEVSGDAAALEMNYPSTRSGQLAMLCWMAGFQTLFVCAAPMSLLTRLTNRRDLAIVLSMALGVFLVHVKVSRAGLDEFFPLFVVPGMIGCGCACFLFSRFGLAPAMIMAGGMTLRLFLPPVGG